MQLLVITPERAIDGEAGVINHLFEHGLHRLHLRKRLFTNHDYRNYLGVIDRQYHSRISIHGSYELFSEFTLGGIHLNSHSRSDTGIWQQIKDIPPLVISTSFHAWEEIEDNGFPYGYVFISPVFDSVSKRDYKAGIDLRYAKELKQNLAIQNKYCPPVIGLGGVGIKQIEILHQQGFDGAAMLGAIWQSTNPVRFFKEAMEAIHLLRYS